MYLTYQRRSYGVSSYLCREVFDGKDFFHLATSVVIKFSGYEWMLDKFSLKLRFRFVNKAGRHCNNCMRGIMNALDLNNSQVEIIL